MIFELLKLNIDVTDEEFNSIYPERIRKLATRHWTPVSVAKLASEFLVERPGTRVLDIGSGVGKFCMVGASYTKGYFFGVEQRPDLVAISDRLAQSYDIPTVKFIQSNITSIHFSNYDAFYLFNPFHENIAAYGQIDETIRWDLRLYDLYSCHTHEQLSSLSPGTRLVTYHTSSEVVPTTFKLMYSLKTELLKFWEKVD